MILDWNLRRLINAIKTWKNRLKWAWQRAYRGYDDTAKWSLDYYIAKIAMPVLKQMARYPGHPGSITAAQWRDYLFQMYRAMELIAEDKGIYTEEEEKEIDDGIALFGKWFRALWT